MRNTFPALLFASLISISAADAAEHNIRPGLWEMTTTSDLLRLVPQIPADQMQQLMNLARQNGFDMPQVRNGAATSTVCITQEMADQKIPPDFYQDQLGCAVKNVTRSGNRYKADLACGGPQLEGNGKTEGAFTSPERFAGHTDFDGVVRGNPVNAHADTSGRWISASCGTGKSSQ